MSDWQATLWLFGGVAVILLCDGAFVLLNRAVERADAIEAQQRRQRASDQRGFGTSCWVGPGADGRAAPVGGSVSGVEVEPLPPWLGDDFLDTQASTGAGRLPQHHLAPVGAQRWPTWDCDQ